MQLSKRLLAVTEFITTGNRVADIGCDHAYTSIYLAQQQISPRIIAMDVNQGPVDRARDNIQKFGYKDIVEVRKSNGLEKLRPGEVDTLVIAGMGGGLALEILTAHPEVLYSVKELVLQPQSELGRVRSELQQLGFLIIEENMLKEDGKFYVVVKAVEEAGVDQRENFLLTQEEHFQFGRLLLEQLNPVLADFLRWDREICEGILENLRREHSENSLQRKMEIEDRIKLIDVGLGYY